MNVTIFKITCETESNNFKIGFDSFLLNAANATPNKIENITICKILFLYDQF